MDQIPLQTLKPVEKIPPEDQVNNLSLEVAAVLRNFKPTVRSRREFEPDDDVDFDTAYEKELQNIDASVDSVYLKDTLPRIEAEINLWLTEYKNLLDEFSKLNETEVKDQVSENISGRGTKIPYDVLLL